MKRIFHPESRSGFTLIELVVTIAILLVVAVIVIPSVRMMNKDRKVHDTARVVGAVFSAARERAAVDGLAGVEIVPLESSPGNFNLPNMGMAVYQLRAIPPYIGDLADATATAAVAVGPPVPVPPTEYYDVMVPGDLTSTGADIKADDYLELNHSGVYYRVVWTGAPLPAGTIRVAVEPHDPPPPLVAVPFKIFRQPVRVESSVVRLPRNLFLNLSWSGFGISGNQFGLTNPLVTDPFDPGYNVPVKIWFNRDGSIDRAFNRDGTVMQRVNGPLYILMSTGEGDEIDVTALGAQRFIEDDDNLWIVVDHRNGSVTLGAIAELGPAITVAEKITASRSLAKNRRSKTP